MSRLKRLIVEVHRRSLWQVLLIYVGGAWFAYQVVWTFTESLGLPTWFPRVGLALLIVLLPVVLATAFVQEGVGERVPRRTILLVAVIYVASALVGFYLVMGLTRQFDLPDWLPGVVAVLLIVLLPMVLWTAFVKEEAPGEAEDVESSVGEPEASGLRGVLTWRNAFVGAVVLFALLGVGVTGYMGMRLLGIGPIGTLIAKGVLQERDLIVLADFEDHTGDSILALTVTEALRVDLSQSRVVKLADPEYVSKILRRMQRNPQTTLSAELAREAAIRGGMKAVLEGAIHRVGTDYILSLQLVAAETGAVLLTRREAAEDATLIETVDRLSGWLRTRIGESLETIRGSEPLALATTSSLEALRMFSLARRTLDGNESEALLKGAIELDSSFALAHAALGGHYYGQNNRPQGDTHFDKALQLSGRLTESERLWIEALAPHYRGDYEEAIRRYKILLERYPNDLDGQVNLLHAYLMLDRCDEAFQSYEGLLYTQDAQVQVNIATCYNMTGRNREAIPIYLKAFELEPDLLMAGNLNHEWGFNYVEAGDLEAAQEVFTKMLAGEDWQKARGRRSLGLLYMYQGKYSAAINSLKEAVLYNKAAGADLSELRDRLYLAVAYHGKDLRREFGEQLDAVDEIRRRVYIEPTFLLYAGKQYLRAGRTGLAEELLNEISARMNEGNRWDKAAFNTLKGEVGLARGDYGEAIELLELASVLVDNNYFLESLARAHIHSGDIDEAAAEYEKLVSRRDLGWEAQEYWILAHYELAKIYEEERDSERASEYFRRFLNIWKAADEDLIHVQDAKERLSRLSSAEQ